MLFNTVVTAPTRPVMTFAIGGVNYQYNGTDLEIAGKIKIVNVGDKGWNMWIYDSLLFDFTYINTPIDLCAVGHGSDGGKHWGEGGGTEYGGGGGNGGQVLNLLNQTFSPGDVISVSIGSSTTVSKNSTVILAPTNGTGASGGSQMAITWGNEAHITDGSAGANGSYAFNDSTFDGIMYAPGGGGGKSYWTGQAGKYYNWGQTSDGQSNPAPGYGGHGWNTNGNGAGGVGIVLMRYTG